MISLDKGITGVVGPNGSGKSNIIDSVRWVMGEQNAKNLRGEKATDIIFAGSEKRKPLGMAEVSLVFDNTDEGSFCPPEYRHEQEIALTRRIFVNGEREYLINKRECRFKELVHFFASTGLGGRSYSMIQQGQVERILNAKPEDVREILEEAAGTAVYKKRKIEAEKKLELTKVNLSRIDDILAEVAAQLSALEGQVSKAKEYQGLSLQLKDQEVSLFAHNFVYFKEQLAKIQSVQQQDRAQETESLALVAGLESRHLELQSDLDESDPEIQILQEKIAMIREKIARAESTLKSSALRLGSGAKRLLDLKKEIAEDDQNLNVLEGQVESSLRSLGDAENATRLLNSTIESFDYEVESATEAAQVYQSRMDEFQDEIRNIERLIESNKFKSEQCSNDLRRFERELNEGKQKSEILDQSVRNTSLELDQVKEQAQHTKQGLDIEIKTKHEREASVAVLYRQNKEALERRDKLKEKYHEVRAKLKSLQEIEKGATDVGATVKQLSETADGQRILENLGGLLADQISFNSDAVELPRHLCAAFEQWTERLVVNDLKTLGDLVRISHKQTLGAMPICLVHGTENIFYDRNKVKSWAQHFSLEPMSRFVTINGNRDYLESLMDKIYIYQGIGLDATMIQEKPPGVTVFTAQGVMIGDDHDLLIGGHGQGGILSRKIEIEHLVHELKSLESHIAQVQGELDLIEHQLGDDRTVIASIDQRLQSQNQDVLAVMTHLESIKQFYDHKCQELENNRVLVQNLTNQIDKVHLDHESLQDVRKSLESELSQSKSELENIREESESLLERREEIRRQHESRRLDLARSEAKAHALRESYSNLKAQLELLQNKLSRRYSESSQIEHDLENAKLEQEESHQSIETYLREREVLEAEFSLKREASAGILEETRVIEGRLKEVREQISRLQKSLAEKNLHLERAKMALSGVVEQALEKYHLDVETYQFNIDPEFNHDAQQKVVAKLRAKIESMGAVNLMAVKEFDEKKARFDFIERQKEEVLSSIDLLIAVISEIEDTSVKKFLEIYERVNSEFGGLFPILFPTGEGRLELTTPEAPLTSGVEIMCRLPGKSRKPMSLFSGGEKALTAISLIFALLKTKPTPFCFLDEVDAPLDEANVGRYNRVLEALSDQFQFIVITHNRRTMEVLDTLYGITMQEPGVSKVVGVDMQKDLPAHLKKSFKEEKSQGEPLDPGVAADTQSEVKRSGAISAERKL